MSAKIRFFDVEAVINGYKWSCPDKTLEQLLNSTLNPYGPSGADPNPDLNAALQFIETYGGELLDYDETEYVEGRIY